MTEARRIGSCTLWIGVELALFADNARVRKIDSERRCIKYEIFRIKVSHFIHVHFRTFALSHFITSRLHDILSRLGLHAVTNFRCQCKLV